MCSCLLAEHSERVLRKMQRFQIEKKDPGLRCELKDGVFARLIPEIFTSTIRILWKRSTALLYYSGEDTTTQKGKCLLGRHEQAHSSMPSKGSIRISWASKRVTLCPPRACHLGLQKGRSHSHSMGGKHSASPSWCPSPHQQAMGPQPNTLWEASSR